MYTCTCTHTNTHIHNLYFPHCSNVKPFAVKVFNPSQNVNVAIQTDEKWEEPLFIDSEEAECKRFLDLGLGRALDNTEQHPWETKSHFQAKAVTFESLSVIQECNKQNYETEIVEDYPKVQKTLNATFQSVFNKPIHVSVAADAQRSGCENMVTSITENVITSRTVAFKTLHPCEREREEFESRLNQWLSSKGCIKCSICDGYQQGSPDTLVQKCETCGKGSAFYTCKTSDSCLEFLKALGGVTHYVTSLTLGAMYSSSQKKNAIKKLERGKETCMNLLGRVQIPVHMRTVEEAVIKYSLASLSDLIIHSHLEKQMYTAIQVYVDEKLHGIRKYMYMYVCM